MKLSSLLHPKLIKPGLLARTKEETLREMVEVLVTFDPALAADEIMQALAERERLGPFSMGKGAAFPHARTEKVKEFTIVIGTVPDGIDFRAPDGNPIRVIVLFVIPKKHSNLYLQTLAQFLSVFATEGQIGKILAARSGEELVAVLEAFGGKKESAVRDSMGSSPPPVQPSTSLARTVDLMVQSRTEALPVLDEEGNLMGEATAAAILRLGLREYVSTLGHSATLKVTEPFDGLLRIHGETALENLPGVVLADSFETVQEEAPLLETAFRLTRSGSAEAYVLKGRRLVGQVSMTDLLQRISGKT